MRILKRLTLGVLAALPVSTISIAAHSQLLDMAGEEQNNTLREDIMRSKTMLFPEMTIHTSIEAAKLRVQVLTGINDPAILDAEVKRHVDFLMEKGLIETNDKMMRSSIPSFGG